MRAHSSRSHPPSRKAAPPRNVNFLPNATAANNTPGAGANITTASAYQDLNNQFDPGGRLGQVMFRLNW